jgi:hypothetical protein
MTSCLACWSELDADAWSISTAGSQLVSMLFDPRDDTRVASFLRGLT